MVEVLIVLDGASDDRGSMQEAETPALDRLATEGVRGFVELLAPGVPVGSETAIAALLGWVPEGPVDRAALEAAARGISVRPGERVWRVDVVMAPVGPGTSAPRASAAVAAQAAARLAGKCPGFRIDAIGGHRLLVSGPPPLPAAVAADPSLRVWPPGAVPPRVLDASTTVVGAAGAATGLARLMGARAVTPHGATGRPGSDLAAKRRAALDAIGAGAERIVVHVGGPDEAAHERDRAAKIACIEAADRELIGPLAQALDGIGGTLRVCPDHGCDPETGEHIAGPVPCVEWCTARVSV